MSEQAFQILCPKCQSVVPPDASNCPSCHPQPVQSVELTVAPPPAPEVASMRLKDYHHLVRSNYWAVEGAAVMRRPPGGFRLRAYLPFLLLLVGVLVGTVVALGRL
jgi:hypothetical protein